MYREIDMLSCHARKPHTSNPYLHKHTSRGRPQIHYCTAAWSSVGYFDQSEFSIESLLS